MFPEFETLKTVKNRYVTFFQSEEVYFSQKFIIFSRENFIFKEIYVFHVWNVCAMTFFTILSILTTAMLYGIIWFEKQNNYRILINLMTSSLCWWAIFHNLCIHSWSVLRFLIGPIKSQVLCVLDSLIRNVFSLQVFLIQTFVVIIRYSCIMWAKNPTALQDDFWQLFINLWTVSFSLISQYVYYILPGKNPINFYICMGEYPKFLYGFAVKINYSQITIGFLSLLIHIYVEISIQALRKSNLKDLKSKTPPLYNYVSNGLSVIFVFLFTLALKAVNGLNANEIDSYPNCIYFYIVIYFIPTLFIFIYALSFFYKNPYMRKKLVAEFESIIIKAKDDLQIKIAAINGS
jgi:hypothetical protein